METKLLEIGDFIYSKLYGSLNGRYKVTEVTDTTAKTSIGLFKREYRNVFIEPIHRNKDSDTFYLIETPKIKDDFNRILLLDKIKKTNFRSIDTEKLNQIVKIITP